nr:MAG TPA: Major head protein [Caudoviricetes sp.]
MEEKEKSTEVQGNEQKQPEAAAKTFTQEEVDKLVEGRIWREREKFKDYETLKGKAAKLDEIEEASKSELEKANEKAAALEAKLAGLEKAETVRSIREKVSKETGVPIHLLHGEDEETCTQIANEIVKFAKPSSYPDVKDGGEPNHGARMTKAEILAIKNERERLKAIQDNIDLFS